MLTPMPEVPQISTAGHVLGSTVLNASKEIENLKTLFVSGCPINEKTPTKMTRKSFKHMCVKLQTRAGVFDEGKKVTGSGSTKLGWKSNNICICTSCKIGSNISAGKRYGTPVGMVFVSMKSLLNGG
jgi:hypothetical protein